jgi:hypothetical protein
MIKVCDQFGLNINDYFSDISNAFIPLIPDTLMPSPTAAENQHFITKRLSTLKSKQNKKKRESVEEDLKVVTNDVNFQRVLHNMNELKESKGKQKGNKKVNLKERLEDTLMTFVLSLKKINEQSKVFNKRKEEAGGKSKKEPIRKQEGGPKFKK